MLLHILLARKLPCMLLHVVSMFQPLLHLEGKRMLIKQLQRELCHMCNYILLIRLSQFLIHTS